MTQYKKVWYKNRQAWKHRVVWEEKNGVIPKGYQLHHKDGNKENNRISNLECLSRAEHRAIHTKELRKRKFSCKICSKDFKSGSYLTPKFCSNACRQRDYFLNHKEERNAYKQKWRARTCQTR